MTIVTDYGHAMAHIEISKSQFKAKALEYFRQVEAHGQPIVITDHGSPALEVRKYLMPTRDPFDRLRGSVTNYINPFDSVGEADWDTLK
jgi:hypothetical protein